MYIRETVVNEANLITSGQLTVSCQSAIFGPPFIRRRLGSALMSCVSGRQDLEAPMATAADSRDQAPVSSLAVGMWIRVVLRGQQLRSSSSTGPVTHPPVRAGSLHPPTADLDGPAHWLSRLQEPLENCFIGCKL